MLSHPISNPFFCTAPSFSKHSSKESRLPGFDRTACTVLHVRFSDTSVSYYACGPAATSAFPSSLLSYFLKFLTNLAARSSALASHSEASAYVSLGSRIAGSTPGSSVGTSKLKCGIVFVGASRIAPLKIASMIPRVSLMEIRFPVPFHPVFTR